MSGANARSRRTTPYCPDFLVGGLDAGLDEVAEETALPVLALAIFLQR